MLTSVVPSATRDELARAFAELGPLRDDPEPFLASLFASAARLPIDLTRMLLRFRGDPEASGILLIRGMPIDASLPPTPTTSSASGVKDRFVSEASILLVALMLGEPVAYAEEKNGVLVQNVYPIEAEKRSPSNESSETDLGFHTELSFSRNAPEERKLSRTCHSPSLQSSFNHGSKFSKNSCVASNLKFRCTQRRERSLALKAWCAEFPIHQCTGRRTNGSTGPFT